MTRPLPLAALLLAALLAAAPASAQDADPDAEVRATIARLFDGMRAKDTVAVRSTLHPQARLMTSGSMSGERGVAETPIGAFVRAVGGAPVELDERLSDDYPVLVDDGLAVAWTPYRFYAGGQFSHCGTNAFTLALADEGWKILQVVDTRRRDCPEPAGQE